MIFPFVKETSAFLAIITSLPLSIQNLFWLSVLLTVLVAVAHFTKGR